MFTGIVEEIGTVRHLQRAGQGYDLAISCTTVLEGTRHGDSIAVNGVCLTVTQLGDHGCVMGLSPETRSRTNLTHLKAGSAVNLERALMPNSRMGGHVVQGHIDETGTISRRRTEEDALWITIQASPSLLRYVVPKGFIALDGTSLTVVDVGQDWLSVTLIAYTRQHTTLAQQPVGYGVNIEVDILGKYVEKLLTHAAGTPQGLTRDKLADYGFV